MSIELKTIGVVRTDAEDIPRHWGVSDVEGLRDVEPPQRIVGILQNNQNEQVGHMHVSVVCLDAQGVLLGQNQSFTDKVEAAPGESIPFQVDLHGAIDCSNFLVAGNGRRS